MCKREREREGVGKFWERGGRVKTKVNMNRKFRAFELKGASLSLPFFSSTIQENITSIIIINFFQKEKEKVDRLGV